MFAGLAHEAVDTGEKPARRVERSAYIPGQQSAQRRRIAAKPVSSHLLHQLNVHIIALGMDLFAHKMNKLILAHGQLIHGGAHIAQPALGPDLAEIDGEKTGQLLHLPVNWPDIRVEQAGDITLEQIGIRDKDAAQIEVDHQGGEKVFVTVG